MGGSCQLLPIPVSCCSPWRCPLSIPAVWQYAELGMRHSLCFPPCPSSFPRQLLPGPQCQPCRLGTHFSLQHRLEGELQPTQALTEA